MFKDEQEELRRLEQALLAEEDTPEEEYDGQDQALSFTEADDTRPADGPMVYQNFSNDYGKSLRNYATGYKAYNSDHTDTDLDSYSEEVRAGKKSNGPLVALACILAAGILAVVVYLLVRFGGYF